MTATPETLIGMMVILVAFAFGMVGLLMRSMRQGSKRKRQPVQVMEQTKARPQVAVVASDLPVNPAPEHVPTAPPVASPTATPARPGEVLLMQVWQAADGVLVVQVEGQRYRRLFDIRDGAVGRQVLETINRLAAFSRGEESHSAPIVQPSASSVQVPPPRIVEEQAQAVLDELRQPKVAPKKSRISLDPVPLRRRSEAQIPGLTLNLAEEIDQLLQVRVDADPDFNRRYIHVTSAPDGGLRFVIDNSRYNALDEVPESDVQALIRAAITDWEARR
jgi:hypothetical protein